MKAQNEKIQTIDYKLIMNLYFEEV